MKPAGRSHQATGDAVPNKLPNYLTSFIGRNDQLGALKSLLGRSRMVTLTGPGGAGKSRLAAELGRACLDLWPGGMWWVELAPVGDPRHVPGTVLAALELPARGQAQDAVIAWLAPRQALLALDNCEHLVAACADFCQEVLERCPQLTIIATSREPLRVAGETRWPVSSLSTQFAMELFEARAQLALPDFKIVASNLETVTRICERLDGIPLAIELAAARVGMMAEGEILKQLSDRFPLLTGGNRTAPERLQAMRAAIDWSYRLLIKDEAKLFRRLSVFRGGFTLDSAQAVCVAGTSGTILELISGLVQKSMVVAERAEGWGGRYRLLESQLAFAEDHLQEETEFETVHRRHYEYFRDCLSAKAIAFTGPRAVATAPGFAEAQWIARESANLWAAIGWARDNADDLGLALAADLSLSRSGDLAQLRGLLEELLRNSSAQGGSRVYALNSAAAVANKQGDYQAGLGFAEAGLALARDMGDPEDLAFILFRVAEAEIGRGELGTATQMLGEAISLLKGSSNHRLALSIRLVTADLAFHRGDYTGASDIVTECIITAKAEGEVRGLAISLQLLGWAQLGMTQHEGAAVNFKEAISIHRGLRNQEGICDCLDGLSQEAEARADDRRAMRLAAALKRLMGEISYKVDPWWSEQYEDSYNRARARLGTRRSEEAWNEGWAMSLDRAMDYALGEGESETLGESGPLSRRQREVAKLVAAGLTNREIADRLFITERTAEGHVDRIRSKLAVHSRIEVATWAVEEGLASGPAVPDPAATKKRGTPGESPSTGRPARA